MREVDSNSGMDWVSEIGGMFWMFCTEEFTCSVRASLTSERWHWEVRHGSNVVGRGISRNREEAMFAAAHSVMRAKTR